MTDVFSAERRSAVMRAVKSKNTIPERMVLEIIKGLGLRPKLHDASLPGEPDLVIRTLRLAVFVHGCFWHGHRVRGCRGRRVPKSNTAYWVAKIEKNRSRSRRHRQQLRRMGWGSAVVWECQLRDITRLTDRLRMSIAKTYRLPENSVSLVAEDLAGGARR